VKTEIIKYRLLHSGHYTKRSQSHFIVYYGCTPCRVYSAPMLVRLTVVAGLVLFFAGAMLYAADNKASLPTRVQLTVFQVR